MTTEDTTRDVLNLSQDWPNAEQLSDTARLADLLADDFVGIGPRGFMLTKEEWIGRHASGALRYESLTLDEVTVRPHAGAAIVTGHETDTIQYEGHPMQGDYRTTLVFVTQQGRWRLANVQFSPIAPPPGAGAQPAQQQ
ncbi:MAG TPA: nuclear transport factor 2 family protein [Ktedonobacterales bacterium]|nr:nuclear transport factor 2 family protein [Ktedonobacterales bacterium]